MKTEVRTVTKPPTMPRNPEIELKPGMLGRRPSWCWIVRSREGRILGYGIERDREEAIEYALSRFPDARVPEP